MNMMRTTISAIMLLGLLILSGSAFAQETAKDAPQAEETYLPETPSENMPVSVPAQEASAPEAALTESSVARAPEPAATETPVPAPQEDTYIPSVSSVVVMGNQIISSNTIITKIRTQAGQEISREVINEDIKRLYATGYFQDVRIDLTPDGRNFKVTVVVEEKPVVKKIIIKGNVVFKEEKLLKEITLKEGQILDQHLVKEGVSKIQKKYRDKGYKFATVDSSIDVTQYTREATITIRIDEGEKFRIKEITFSGAEAFKDRKLKKTMRTKKRNLLFFRTGTFNEKKFTTDLERLMFLYQNEGYLDVAITHEFEYDKQDNSMKIVFTVNEGKQYRAGTVKIAGNKLFPESEIWGQLTMLPGEVYSQMQLQEDIDAIRRFYFARGYINAQIVPETNLHKDTTRVDALYTITEGDLYYVDKVKIRGNTKTKDIVIRRELRVRPGERFDGSKLEYSKQRLNNLGYFEEVEYETEPGSAEQKRDVVFRVKEKQTGELSFGAGVSSIDNFIGFAEISQRNFDLFKWPTFTGGGQSISLSGRWGSETRDLDLNFVNPYIFNKPISFGFNAYNWERDSNNLDFDTQRTGAGVTFGHNFTDRLKGYVGYTFERVKLKDVSPDAHADVINTGDTNWLSRGKVGYSYDTRDNIFAPKTGWYLSGSAEMIGGVFFGDQDYYNIQGAANRYINFLKEHVLELKMRGGVTNEFGDSDMVPVFDRFYAGGLGTVRGYNYRRVGPKGNGNPIGGETLALASAEYVFPIIDNFKGCAFVDAGHVNSDAYQVDAGDFAVSVGPGIRINTPLGPITVYYGLPVANKDDKKRHGRIEFNMSRGF